MLRIIRQNGEQFELPDIMQIKQFDVSSPDPETNETKIPGVDGHIDNGTTYKGRNIVIGGNILVDTHSEEKDVRRELFKIFESKKFFYLIEYGEDTKRWRVKLEGSFDINKISPIFFSVSIKLKSSSPYSFNAQSTIERNPVEFTKNNNTFSIYNDGDVIIDPKKWYSDLVITYKGASSNLNILNDTTGDSFTYLGDTVEGDVLMIQNLRFLKNNNSETRNTNLKLIQLVPGQNDFVVSGTQGIFEISFEFKELYL